MPLTHVASANSLAQGGPGGRSCQSDRDIARDRVWRQSRLLPYTAVWARAGQETRRNTDDSCSDTKHLRFGAGFETLR